MDLISLPVDKRVSLDGIRKAQVVKTLHESVRQQIEKRNLVCPKPIKGAIMLSFSPSDGLGAYETVRQQIEKRNRVYGTKAHKGRNHVVFQPDNWVWVHMRNERFSAHRKSKLQPRGDGPFQIKPNPFLSQSSRATNTLLF